MATAGVETVRSDAVWDWIEPNQPAGAAHQYNWGGLDGVVSSYASHGLRWAPIVDFSVPWDRQVAGQHISPPAGIANYAAYAGALAARYGDGGSFWITHPLLPYLPVHSYEIWNEENLPLFWQPTPDPSRYADLYIAARQAIHAAQPRALVLVGGLSGPAAANQFVAGMFASHPGLAAQIDGVGLHPYAAAANDALNLVVSLRHELAALGAGAAPIAITEVGWPTGGSAWPVSDSQRASYLSSLDDQLARSDCGVVSFSPHTLVNLGQDPGNLDDSYGLYHPDATPTASAIAYSNASLILEGRAASSAPNGTLRLCGGSSAAPPGSSGVRLRTSLRSPRQRAAHRAKRRVSRRHSHGGRRRALNGAGNPYRARQMRPLRTVSTNR
jgi:hypothetical protein